MSAVGSELSNLIEPRLLFGFTNLPELRQQAPLRIVRGEGVFVYDAAGKDYVEGVSSFYRTALGFSEEALVEAAAAQMREMPFYVSAAARTLPVLAGLRLAGK